MCAIVLKTIIMIHKYYETICLEDVALYLLSNNKTKAACGRRDVTVVYKLAQIGPK